MNKYYIEYKVWAGGLIDTPWPTKFLEGTNQYKTRKDMKLVSPNVVKSIFLSMNEISISKFLELHIIGSILGSIVETDDPNKIQKLLEKDFGVIEVLGACEYEPNKEVINTIMLNEVK